MSVILPPRACKMASGAQVMIYKIEKNTIQFFKKNKLKWIKLSKRWISL
jgi:hypothetical protein